MLRVNVALPSGRREGISIPSSSTVGHLRTLTQKAFGQGFLRLLTAEGHVLSDHVKSLQAAGIEDGDNITAFAQQKVQLASTGGAFALWRCGGDTVVTWGAQDSGGDVSAVQDQLRSVQQVQASQMAFAAGISL